MKFQKFITIMQHLERLPKKQSWKFQNLKNEWNWMHQKKRQWYWIFVGRKFTNAIPTPYKWDKVQASCNAWDSKKGWRKTKSINYPYVHFNASKKHIADDFSKVMLEVKSFLLRWRWQEQSLYRKRDFAEKHFQTTNTTKIWSTKSENRNFPKEKFKRNQRRNSEIDKTEKSIATTFRIQI